MSIRLLVVLGGVICLGVVAGCIVLATYLIRSNKGPPRY